MNLLKIICIGLLLPWYITGSSQSILLGVRDNQFARIGYSHNNLSITFEHSVFITKFKNQVLNGYLKYQGTIGQINYYGTLYSGFHYSNLYHSYGGICELKYFITPWWQIKGGIRPHYDSNYGYKTAYLGNLSFKLHHDIYLIATYSNYPEYRLCEKRVKGGLLLHVQNLEVKPEISIPINNKMENIRFLLSFNYELKIK